MPISFQMENNCLNPGISIPNAEQWNKKTYLVSCNGPCSQIRIHIEFNGGDADLLADEGEHPITSSSGYQCPTCSMCQATSGNGYEETCSSMATQNGNRYFPHLEIDIIFSVIFASIHHWIH